MPTAMEKRLGELLVKDNVISSQDLDAAWQSQKNSGSSLGRILQEMGVASEWEIAAVLGKQLNVPFITLSQYEIDPDVLHSIPENIVKRYKIVPVDRTGDTLTIALSDPSNIYLLDELRLLCKSQIVPVISFESDIAEAISRYNSNGESNRYDEMLKDIDESTASLVPTEEDSRDAEDDSNDLATVNDAPVIQLVNLIIQEAIKKRASDIHLEPYEKTLRLR